MNVVHRTARSVGVMLGLCTVAAVLLWWATAQYRTQVQDIGSRLLPAMKTVLSVMAEVRETRLLETQLLALRTDDGLRTAERLLNRQQRALAAHIESHAALDTLDQQLQRDVFNAALAHHSAQQQVLAATRRALDGTAAADAPMQLSQGVSLRAYEALTAAVDGWRMHSEQLAEARSQAASNPIWLVAGAVALWLGALAWGWRGMRELAHAIQEPLKQAHAALRAIARGEAGYPIKVRRLDEFGRLLVAIDGLRDTLALAASAADDDSVDGEGEPVRPPATQLSPTPTRSLEAVATTPAVPGISAAAA